MAEITCTDLSTEYTLEKKLEEGGFGCVWLGTERTTGETRAIKTFHNEGKAKTEMRKLLEMRERGVLDHQGLIATLAILPNAKWSATGNDGAPLSGTGALVMETAPNSELFGYIMGAQSGLPETVARFYFIQLLEIVQHLHNNGTYHRDLKPENMLLDEHFNMKLCDFGMVKVNPEEAPLSRSRSGNVGTDGYRAPEVLPGGDYDPSKSDVYALGVLLYVLVSYRAPSGVTNGHFYRDESLSPQVRDLIAQCTQRVEGDRCSMETVWDHEWLKGPVPDRSSLVREMEDRRARAIEGKWIPQIPPSACRPPSPPGPSKGGLGMSGAVGVGCSSTAGVSPLACSVPEDDGRCPQGDIVCTPPSLWFDDQEGGGGAGGEYERMAVETLAAWEQEQSQQDAGFEYGDFGPSSARPFDDDDMEVDECY